MFTVRWKQEAVWACQSCLHGDGTGRCWSSETRIEEGMNLTLVGGDGEVAGRQVTNQHQQVCP